MVREQVPAASIYHFIHIPWPSVHFWRLLPRSIRLEIFESLCTADLIGFQTEEDARNFLHGCSQFIDQATVDVSSGTVDWKAHCTKVRTYPTSIDIDEVRKIASSPRVAEYEQALAPMYDKHTIVRVDRAEPSKNIVRGFRSYQIFLERYPEFREQVNFFAFLVPARTHIKQYERYREEIDNLVKNINTTYGTSTWTPIQIFYENNYAQALAGMRLYDTLLVNSVADGMNLVAKEGPVVNSRNGVLILSEGTGAYSQLRDGALVVAPTDLHGGAEALYQAVTMGAQDRADRNAMIIEKVKNEDVLDWLLKQLRELDQITSSG